MALKTTVEGPGKVTASSVSTRRFISSVTFTPSGSTESITIFFKNTEVTRQETREWYALTQQAAEATVEANVQPEDQDTSYSYTMDIDVEVIPSYKLIRTEQELTITSEQFGLETAATVTFSPDSSGQPESPVAVTVTSSSGEWVYYETGSEEPDNPTLSSDRVLSGSTVNVPVPGIIKAFAIDINKSASVISSAEYTLQE